MKLSTAPRPGMNSAHSWQRMISETYFPLEFTCPRENEFRGELEAWSLGEVSVSRMESDGGSYRRHRHHLKDEANESLLITIPRKSVAGFSQGSREVSCQVGELLVERADSPYEFWHSKPNRMLIIKVPIQSVQARVGPAERLAAMTFDITTGIGGYFADSVRLAILHAKDLDEKSLPAAGKHVLDLLCLTIQDDERVLDSSLSSIRTAHLRRAELYILNNLDDENLVPKVIADACGISLRYLQSLFTESNRSIIRYIREQRLARCDEEMRMNASNGLLCELAYKWGFSDQSSFCKYYRNQYGRTPSESLQQYRELRNESQPVHTCN